MLTSRLKRKNLLEDGVRIIHYRSWHEEFLSLFRKKERLVYNRDVCKLPNERKIEVYKHEE